MNLTIISTLLPEISKTFSLSMADVGVLFTAEYSGFVVFVLIGGCLADKLGKKLVVVTALFSLAVTLILFTLSGTFFIALILMALIGGLGGIIESIVTAMVSDLNENKSFYVNLSQVFFGFGAIISSLGGGLIISKGADWKLCYYILAMIILIPAIPFAAYKMPVMPQTGKLNFKELVSMVKNKKIVSICLCMTFYTGAEVGSWGWLTTFLKQNMRFSITKAGAAVAVFWTTMTVGRFLCGPLTLRYKLKSIIIVLAALSSMVTLFTVFTDLEILIWFVIITMGLTYSSQFPLIVNYGTKNSLISSGITVSLLMGSGAVGSMAVPYLMGLVGNYTGLRFAMIIPVVLLMLVAVIFAGFSEK